MSQNLCAGNVTAPSAKASSSTICSAAADSALIELLTARKARYAESINGISSFPVDLLPLRSRYSSEHVFVQHYLSQTRVGIANGVDLVWHDRLAEIRPVGTGVTEHELEPRLDRVAAG